MICASKVVSIRKMIRKINPVRICMHGYYQTKAGFSLWMLKMQTLKINDPGYFFITNH
jgi:hypothetical protein